MSKSRVSRANQTASWLLVLFLIGSSLALGGNRPQFWLLNFGVLSLVTALYLFLVTNSRSHLVGVEQSNRAIIYLALAYPVLVIALTLTHWFSSTNPSLLTPAFGLIRVFSYILFAWLAFQALRNERRALTAARLTVIGLSILAFYGLISTDNPNLLFYEKISYDGFATGPFVNRNSFATLLAMGATLSLALAITPQDQSTRRSRTQSNPLKIDRVIGQALAFSPVLLFLSCALLTGSRMGLFVTFLGMGLVVLLGGRLSSVSRVKVMALAVLLATILIVAFTLSFGQLTFDRLGSTGASADVRGNLYITIINMIKEAPILGHGFDSFTQSYRLFHTAPVSADLRWDQAHNTYLELWAELGLLVGSIPPLICLLAGVNLYRRAIVPKSKAAPLACAGFASIFACAIHSLVDFSLEMPTNVYLLIFITAMGLAPQAKSRIGA